jgi:outer membrane receptor protein involved in Fe transport
MVGNVGKAKVEGLELSFRALIGEGLDVGLDATWLDARMDGTSELLPTVASDAPLPLAPDLKYAVYAQYTWPVGFAEGGEMYVRGQYTFTDDTLNRLEPFPEEPPGTTATAQRTMDSYGIADASVGITAERWEVQAFVDNLTDEHAELYWNTDDHQTFWGRNNLATNRPTEYGLRFIYRWGQ